MTPDMTLVYDEGYGAGYSSGYEDGYSEGVDDGLDDGYDHGYEDGCNYAKSRATSYSYASCSQIFLPFDPLSP